MWPDPPSSIEIRCRYNGSANILYEKCIFLSKHKLFWEFLHNFQLIRFINDDNVTTKCINNYHLKMKNIPSISDETILFSVIRHPQERIESLYKYTQSYKYFSFKEFVEKITKTNFLDFISSPQLSFLCDKKNEKKLDKRIHILRYENLNKDWEFFCKKNNIKYYAINKENVSDKNKDIVIEWTDKLRRMVYKKYKCDFKIFNYKLY